MARYKRILLSITLGLRITFIEPMGALIGFMEVDFAAAAV
jgi:hypothetical protein